MNDRARPKSQPAEGQTERLGFCIVKRRDRRVNARSPKMANGICGERWTTEKYLRPSLDVDVDGQRKPSTLLRIHPFSNAVHSLESLIRDTGSIRLTRSRWLCVTRCDPDDTLIWANVIN